MPEPDPTASWQVLGVLQHAEHLTTRGSGGSGQRAIERRSPPSAGVGARRVLRFRRSHRGGRHRHLAEDPAQHEPAGGTKPVDNVSSRLHDGGDPPVTGDEIGRHGLSGATGADLDKATPILAKSILQNAGQTCSAGSRVLVAAEIHTEVVERLAAEFRRVRIGHGSTDPDLGPVISAKQQERVLGYIERGRTEARVITGGGRPQDATLAGGYYVSPTLFDQVDPDATIAQEEIFGPVLVVSEFADLDEAVQIANGTEYGLVAGVWTRDLSSAHRLIRDLDCGQVMVNTFSNGAELPFSGRHSSGFGVEKGFEGLLAFTQLKGAVVDLGR